MLPGQAIGGYLKKKGFKKRYVNRSVCSAEIRICLLVTCFDLFVTIILCYAIITLLSTGLFLILGQLITTVSSTTGSGVEGRFLNVYW